MVAGLRPIGRCPGAPRGSPAPPCARPRPFRPGSEIRLTSGSSATSESISTPQVHRSGVHHPHVGRGHGELLAVQAEEAGKYSRVEGTRATLHPAPAAGAASSPRRRRRCPCACRDGPPRPIVRPSRGSGVGGPTTRTWAPSMLSMITIGAGRLRGCRASRRRRWPRSRPSTRPKACLIARASSSAWVGCSCWPSPALTTLPDTFLRQQGGGAGRGVAHHQQVGVHGVQRHRRRRSGSSLLGHGRGARVHVDDVCAEPLAGQLEGALGAGRVLKEQVHQRRGPSSRSSFLAFASG